MKKDIHPNYYPVVFVDSNASTEYVTRSTKKSNETRVIDGVEHFVIRVEISAASHPFYTGKQKFVDAAGRIEKFQKKYAGKYGTEKNAADAAAAAITATAARAEAAKVAAVKAAAAAKVAAAAKAAKAKAAALKAPAPIMKDAGAKDASGKDVPAKDVQGE